MKVSATPQNQRGSFGIPPEINPGNPEMQKKHQQDREEALGDQGPPQVEDDNFSFDTPPTPGEGEGEGAADKIAAKTDPLAILKDFGVDLIEEDFSKLLFRGFLEKDVNICRNPFTKEMYQATFKTLTAEEYDDVDELVAEDLKNKEMTRDGLDTRRRMWVMSFGITKLMGRNITKPKTKKGKDGSGKVADLVDSKATAQEKRKILSQLSPAYLSVMMQRYWTFEQCIRTLMEDKDGFLAKP